MTTSQTTFNYVERWENMAMPYAILLYDKWNGVKTVGDCEEIWENR